MEGIWSLIRESILFVFPPEIRVKILKAIDPIIYLKFFSRWRLRWEINESKVSDFQGFSPSSSGGFSLMPLFRIFPFRLSFRSSVRVTFLGSILRCHPRVFILSYRFQSSTFTWSSSHSLFSCLVSSSVSRCK